MIATAGPAGAASGSTAKCLGRGQPDPPRRPVGLSIASRPLPLHVAAMACGRSIGWIDCSYRIDTASRASARTLIVASPTHRRDHARSDLTQSGLSHAVTRWRGRGGDLRCSWFKGASVALHRPLVKGWLNHWPADRWIGQLRFNAKSRRMPRRKSTQGNCLAVERGAPAEGFRCSGPINHQSRSGLRF